MRVAIRTDASSNIGTGHVMRCLTLADTLANQGWNILFLSRPHAGSLIDLIESHGYPVFALGYPQSDSSAGLKHSSWLGSSQEEDAIQCAEYLRHNPVDWIIVDHYGLDKTWQFIMRDYCHRLMVIDDLGDRKHGCDVLLDPNYGSTKEKYLHLVPRSCAILAGSDFALLRSEFSEWREISLKRRKHPKLENLLINLGGVDADNITTELLLELEKCDLPNDLKITVILGPTAPHLARVKQVISQSDYAIDLIIGTTEMARILARADLAIGAAGSTTWERCCLGLPTIMIAIAENQDVNASILNSVGAVCVIREVNELASQLSLARSKLKLLSQVCQKLVDGNGASRIGHFLAGAHVSGEKFVLFPYTSLSLDQAKFVLEMRNHEEVRKWMHNKSLISEAEHFAFIDGLKICADKWYFLVQETSEVLGCVSFTEIDSVAKRAEFGIFANPFLKQRGRGRRLIELAIEFAKEVLELRALDLEVVTSNKAALDLYTNYSFIKQRSFTKNTQRYLKMTKFIE